MQGFRPAFFIPISFLESGNELVEFLAESLHGVPLRVIIRSVIEALIHELRVVVLLVVLRRTTVKHDRGQDGIVLAQIDSAQRVGSRNHLLVEFLTRPDAHLHLFQVRSDSRSHVSDAV